MDRLKEKLRNKIEAIMDNETVALTKTGDKDFNPPEIVNFDTVVLNKYEAVNKLLEFINQNYISKQQILNLECLKKEKITKNIFSITQLESRNQLRNEIKKEIKKL